MILPYFLRLVCLSLAAFFLVHTGVGLATILVSPAALRFADRLRPRTAARFLFALRLLPFALGLLVVVGLCVPSYLWFEPRFEPEEVAEQVGLLCMAAALMGGAICLISITRALRGLASSIQRERQFETRGSEVHVAGDAAPILVIEEQAPILVLAGIVHPRVLISRSVVRHLSAEQLDVALGHERAHRTFHDNFKRFLLLLSPDVLPFCSGFTALEQGWARLTEWAADDAAVEGDPGRALSLAAAIIGLARMGAGRRIGPLVTALVAEDQDLATRVNRLLAPQAPQQQTLGSTFWGSATVVIAGSMATLVLALGAPFSSVHQLLEQLIR